MSLHNSLWLFLAIQAVGLAVWLTLSVINNCHGFGGSTGAVGATMSMTQLKQLPAINTPLLSRAIGSRAIHRMALLVVLALQTVAASACWAGCWQLLVAMHLGGLWFGYWIRQEGLQLTHLVLLIWAVAAFFLFNTQWV